MEPTRQNLEDMIKIGIDTNTHLFAAIIHNEFTDQEELIVNTMENMVNGKLDYYMTAYDEDLRLITQPKIRIVRFVITNIFDDLQDIY